MANYNSDLKTWGSTGVEYPNGYSYTDGEQPVDGWDNFFNFNAEKDIDHLISLTNKRLESGSGTSYPGSPEDGELFWRSDNSRLAINDDGEWRQLAYRDDDSGQILGGDSGFDGIAVGPLSRADVGGTISVGNGAESYYLNAMAIGTDAICAGGHSAAIGNDATVTAARAVALGNNAECTNNYTGVLGVAEGENGPYNWKIPGNLEVESGLELPQAQEGDPAPSSTAIAFDPSTGTLLIPEEDN